ncbi:hypothetical protein B0J11DRAFT_79587 [Dendryphion nanum]|uniref:Uncharacterized protein n=1 Tax=Dendryphion nanum TaxID=256645 RepID=A0A9P9DGM0_9PLEO|nr:hypothetical protein B0J11DRAFT_79587 [Dendryphion nanum]
MAFRQHHRPQTSRQLSFHTPEAPPPEVGATASPQRKRPLEESEEWVLFSPVAPSTTARTHTTSTERTPRTTGLSRFSDFGSLDTAARSDQDDDAITYHGTEEELDSLDDGLHAFHEPSEYGVPTGRLQQSGETVLPTHDGLGTFQPDANVQDHMWQFERQSPRRRPVRRRSSVQRRLDALEEAEEIHQEQDRRQRIENWRLEQSRALIEEIERETRRRRRMSMVSAARSRTGSTQQDVRGTMSSHVAQSVSDGQSVSSDESTEHLSFWQRLTRRVIRDLIGLDEDTLSVIFGESLPEEVLSDAPNESASRADIDTVLQSLDGETFPGEPWQHRLLERVARELGILVSQLSEHPGAFSTYRLTQEMPEYAGLPVSTPTANNPTIAQPTPDSPTAPHFAPTFNPQSSNPYNEASLWGIEEEPSTSPLSSFRAAQAHIPAATAAEDLAREREYWERELDTKMVFNFLVKRFSSSRRPSLSSTHGGLSAPPAPDSENDGVSARRAAMIRQNHPLVNRVTERGIPVLGSSSSGGAVAAAPAPRRKESLTYRAHFGQGGRSQGLRSSSSCASQSTKKSKRSGGSGRNYWDLGGSVGSVAGEV